ncbi:MAG: response regulator transcription factor [Actinobacteria bacterium]|nr:response regulator transcription factor [Actinomycetota bacterium]
MTDHEHPVTTSKPARPRALVCDDDPMVRRVVSGLLTGLGYDVVAEVDLATDALRVVELTKPDLVVLDVALMGLSGIEAIPSIRSSSPHSRVVVFSAFDTVRDDALAAGAVAVVDKTDAEGLEETLRRLARA